jgi:hypothetical protein
MKKTYIRWLVIIGLITGGVGLAQAQAVHPGAIVALSEQFTVGGTNGWRMTPQDLSYASHTYGGMWVTHGGLLGAPAEAVGAVARQTVLIPTAGAYRVWSKYQAPPYFNYPHRVEIHQANRKIFTHLYGLRGSKKIWSFTSGEGKKPDFNPEFAQCWWPWGMDHDAAEAPLEPVPLAAGPAEIRLIAEKGPDPVADRFVDFILLTTNLASRFEGYVWGTVKSPFTVEAVQSFPLYMRFKNTSAAPALVTLNSQFGHYTVACGWRTGTFPFAPVAAGDWSPWFDVARDIVHLVTEEGISVTLAGATEIPVQIALDADGEKIVGDLKVPNGESVYFPLDLTWAPGRRVRLSRDVAQDLIRLSRTEWRTASKSKPNHILFYGAFRATERPWVNSLKDALGYNTVLPEPYAHAKIDGYHQHAASPGAIVKLAEALEKEGRRNQFRVCSFGDEIHIGEINYQDPQYLPLFLAWLKQKKISAADLGGVEPGAATLMANPRVAWYSRLFGNEQRFAHYRQMTETAVREIGPQVLAGANYSPHSIPQYYGALPQWVDIFKHNGMSLFWTEDYLFSVPEPPQMISWMFAQIHCAVKYNHQPIHFYVMPHAPGQTAGSFRRNLLFAVGAGARHIDNFWIAPMENWSENYISWYATNTWRVLHESIYDTAAAESLLIDAQPRPARVALVLSRATDVNEGQTMIPKAQDPFVAVADNAPTQIQQIICRKDQQALYLALRQAGYTVDLITEDDIVEDGTLRNYRVVYFAGEWIDHRVPALLDRWIQDGGIFYATAGLGHLNEFNEESDALWKLLGLQTATLAKNFYHPRPKMELVLAQPIDTLKLGEQSIAAIGMKQQLQPLKDGVSVLGTWSDGSPAVTVREWGRGKAFAVGTLPGQTWLKTGLLPVPWTRGGSKYPENPVAFDPAAAELALLGVSATGIDHEVEVSVSSVEALVLDNPKGTLVTLVNWNNAPVGDLRVSVRSEFKPKAVRSIQQGRTLAFTYEKGRIVFQMPLEWADYVMLMR